MMGNGAEGGCRLEPRQEDRLGEQEDGESLALGRSHAGEGGQGNAREGGGGPHRAAEWAVSLRDVPGAGGPEMGG